MENKMLTFKTPTSLKRDSIMFIIIRKQNIINQTTNHNMSSSRMMAMKILNHFKIIIELRAIDRSISLKIN